MVSSKKNFLDFEPETDFYLLGLVSYEPDYKLVWDINRCLYFDFRRTEDHQVKHRKSNEFQLFSCFLFRMEDKYIDLRILSNKGEQGVLIEELKNLDYLLLISGEQPELVYSSLKTDLKNVESVVSVFEIHPSTLKEAGRLVFD